MSKQKKQEKYEKQEKVNYLDCFVDGMLSIMEEMWSILTFGAYRSSRNPIKLVKSDYDKLTPEEKYQKLCRKYGIKTDINQIAGDIGKVAADVERMWLKTIVNHTSISVSFCEPEVMIENLPITSPVVKQSGLKLIFDHQKKVCHIKE